MSNRSVGTIKLPNDATKFYDGTGVFDTVKDSDLDTSDITTNNVSTSKHGFAPKAPNDAAKYLDGTGAYSVPGSSSGGLVKIASTLLGSDQASISFTSISASYLHLKLVIQARSAVGSTADNLAVQLNGDTTGAYDWDYVLGKNTAPTSADNNSQTSALIGFVAGNTASRSTLAGVTELTIANYANTTFEKHMVSMTSAQESGLGSGMYVGIIGALWRSTAAVNRVDIFAQGGNLKAGSIATLYGMA